MLRASHATSPDACSEAEYDSGCGRNGEASISDRASPSRVACTAQSKGLVGYFHACLIRGEIVEDLKVFQHFNSLFDDFSYQDFATAPLLAHYTSIEVAEKILMENTIWLSNPLFMNDLEEIRFIILNGTQILQGSSEIKAACGNGDRYKTFRTHFDNLVNQFSNEHAVDTYIFCLSEYDEASEKDGLLSMWRGYGANGNGVALVFDPKKIIEVPDSPLWIGKVDYLSRDKRIEWIGSLAKRFSDLFQSIDITDEQVGWAAIQLFERLKLFALFTKHLGFHEEREWRVVYLRNRDVAKALDKFFHYWIGPRGIEPKLMFEISSISGVSDPSLALENLFHKILIGPSVSSPIAKLMIQRMLQKCGKASLCEKVFASDIPYRPS